MNIAFSNHLAERSLALHSSQNSLVYSSRCLLSLDSLNFPARNKVRRMGDSRSTSTMFLTETTVPLEALLGSLRYGHYGLRTTVIHGEDLVRDLLRMLDSTWVSQSVVWLQATGSSRGDSRSEDYVSIFLPIFDQFCFLNATFMLNSL